MRRPCENNEIEEWTWKASGSHTYHSGRKFSLCHRTHFSFTHLTLWENEERIGKNSPPRPASPLLSKMILVSDLTGRGNEGMDRKWGGVTLTGTILTAAS
jgi:hypothetical protein